MTVPDFSPFPFGSHNVLAVILGGGRGTRLFPLTAGRAKPAVPLAGKYRLVDIPISNCINSGLHRIFLLTQFNSASLHRHVSQSYKFDHFSGGFVEILAAEQTLSDESWYQGTADAVRKNLVHFHSNDFDYMLILSGDQLYRMDYRRILEFHVDRGADVTVGTTPVTRSAVAGLGIMRVGESGLVTAFVEKPKERAEQDDYRVPAALLPRFGLAPGEDHFLASMGIYVFNRDSLVHLLDVGHHDFGKEVIPQALSTHRVNAYVFRGAWEDIGTIRTFFECSLDLASPNPRFDMFEMTAPVFTRPRFLPASQITGEIEQSMISDGCLLRGAVVRHSIVGLRSIVGKGSRLFRTVLMGNDYYEDAASVTYHRNKGTPPLGIGENTVIENAIIDKNARVGDDCRISPAGKAKHADHELYYIRDGVVVVPKNAVVPNGTKI